MLTPALQTRSLTQVTAIEGFERNRRGLYSMILGVDARYDSPCLLLALTDICLSIWMMKAQIVFHKPSHAQCGKNPELCALFYWLCYLARFQLSAVFVFDGAGRPSSKHGKQVRSKPHWLTEDFKKFISMFGFHYYVVCPSISIPSVSEQSIRHLAKLRLNWCSSTEPTWSMQ